MALEDDTKMWLHGQICLLHILKLARIKETLKKALEKYEEDER